MLNSRPDGFHKYEIQGMGSGCWKLTTPKRLMELQETINADLLKASLPGVRIDGFKLPDQALEIAFERETVIGENKERLWEIINGHYKKLLRELGLKE